MKKKLIITIIAAVFVCFLSFVFLIQTVFKNENKGMGKMSTNDSFAIITEGANNFMECADAGNPVMESYPRKCAVDDKVFIEEIGNELEKQSLIRLNSPRPNQLVSSPLVLEGEARGIWFFEGDFPVVLTNWDGLIIAEGYATAKGDWMTEEFVSFEATIEFEGEELYPNGTLILQKDNPSGLPENGDALEVPILFYN